jgi:hypothetical protein
MDIVAYYKLDGSIRRNKRYFSSKQTCEIAAESISHRFIVFAGKAREQQGIQSNTFKSAPSIWQECINIQK